MASSLVTKKQGPSAEDWERLRPTIRWLYIDEGRCLNVIRAIMASDYRHQASNNMYKKKFARWGDFDKHNRPSDMAFVARKMYAYDMQGKRPAFVVGSRRISAKEADRYFERKRALDPDFQEAPADVPTPIHIHSVPPSPDQESQYDTALWSGEAALPLEGTENSGRSRKRKRSARPVESRMISWTPEEHHQIRVWTRSPSIPILVTLPDVLLKAETLFTAISIWVRGSLDAGLWFEDDEGFLQKTQPTILDPQDLLSLFEVALTELKNASHRRATRLLSKCFSLLKLMLQDEDPMLLQVLLEIFTSLRRRGYIQLGTMFQNYIFEMAKTVLAKGTAWRQICISVSLPDEEHAEVVTRSWRCLTDEWGHALGRFSYASILNEVTLIVFTYRHGDHERGMRCLQRLLADYEQVHTELSSAKLYLIECLVHLLRAQLRLAEAEKLLANALERARGAGVWPNQGLAGVIYQLALVQYQSGQYELAEYHLREAITMYTGLYGVEDAIVMRFYIKLENWLREWDRYVEADELRTTIDEWIGPEDDDA